MVTFTVTFSSDDDRAAPLALQNDLQGAGPPGLRIDTEGSVTHGMPDLGAAAPPDLVGGISTRSDLLPPEEGPPPVPGLATGMGAGSDTVDNDLGGAEPPPV